MSLCLSVQFMIDFLKFKYVTLDIYIDVISDKLLFALNLSGANRLT